MSLDRQARLATTRRRPARSGCSNLPIGNGHKPAKWAGGIALAGARCSLVPRGLRLDEWREEGRLTTIKSGRQRIVYRVDLPEGPLYIKHFLVPDRRAKYRQWVRRGKGRNEGKRSQLLASIGVPTITPVALGEQRKRKFRVNFLSRITWSRWVFATQRLWMNSLKAGCRTCGAAAIADTAGAGRIARDHDGPPAQRRPSCTRTSTRETSWSALRPRITPELVMIDLDCAVPQPQCELEAAHQEPGAA